MSTKSNRLTSRKKKIHKIVLPKEPKVPSPLCTNLKCRKRIRHEPKVAKITLPGTMGSTKMYGLCDECAVLIQQTSPRDLVFQ